MTDAEKLLWSRLRGQQVQGLKYWGQNGIGPYIVDFYCPEKPFVIEVDDEIHAKVNQIIKEKEREIFLKNLGLHVIRYKNDNILKNLNAVLEDLSEKLSLASTSPHPLLTKEGD